MKNKLKVILLTIICIMIMPILVKADMGAPESYHYEVIVSNPKGAVVYDWDGKATEKVIPFDTKATVALEYTINGELYVDIYYDDDSEYVKIEGMIKISDTKLYSEEINFSKLSKNEDKIQYYALEDTELYKGPSTAYGKIENITIPAGTTIDFTHSSSSDELGVLDVWIYTEYKGNKGWVYTYPPIEGFSPYTIDCTVAKVEKGKILIVDDQDVLDHQGNVVGQVKKLEEYEYNYIIEYGPRLSDYYIKSDKIEGWIRGSQHGPETNGVVPYYEKTFLSIKKDGLELYEDYMLTKKVKDLKIPHSTEFTTYYQVGTDEVLKAGQITYNGKKYWVDVCDEQYIIEHGYYDYTIKTEEELQMYKYNDETEALNVTIPVEATLVTKWNHRKDYSSKITWYYVEYEGTKGWISVDSSKNEAQVKEETKPTEEPEDEPQKEEPTEKKEEKSLTPKQTAFVAIGVAVLLGIGSLFTILLINKNKKVKNETPAEEKEPIKEDNKE